MSKKMNIKEYLKSLKNNIRIYTQIDSRFSSWSEGIYTGENKLKITELAEEINKKNCEVKEINPVDLEKLYKKVKLIQRNSSLDLSNKHSVEQLTNRDKRNLIYILDRTKTRMTWFILSKFTVKKFSFLKRAVYVYLKDYDNQTYKTDALGEKIIAEAKSEYIGKLKYISNTGMKEEFFENKGKCGLEYYVNSFVENGIVATLEKMELPEGLYDSKFIKKAVLEAFYKLDDAKMCMNLLEELFMLEKEYGKNILTYIGKIANHIIPIIDKSSRIIQDRLTYILDNVMGDLRLSKFRAMWIDVSEENKKIYQDWINRKTLKLLLTIIDKSKENNADAIRMFTDRMKFWEKYIPHMNYTWVILDDEATAIAHEVEQNNIDIQLAYGRMENGDSYSYRKDKEKCLFVFEMGEYLFIEGTHNFALRIAKGDDMKVPVKIGSEHVRLIDICGYGNSRNKGNYVLAKAHIGEKWKDDIDFWIADNCQEVF